MAPLVRMVAPGTQMPLSFINSPMDPSSQLYVQAPPHHHAAPPPHQQPPQVSSAPLSGGGQGGQQQPGGQNGPQQAPTPSATPVPALGPMLYSNAGPHSLAGLQQHMSQHPQQQVTNAQYATPSLMVMAGTPIIQQHPNGGNPPGGAPPQQQAPPPPNQHPHPGNPSQAAVVATATVQQLAGQNASSTAMNYTVPTSQAHLQAAVVQAAAGHPHHHPHSQPPPPHHLYLGGYHWRLQGKLHVTSTKSISTF